MCPLRVLIIFCDSGDQRRTNLSQDAVATHGSTLENDVPRTQPKWPRRVATIFSVDTFHSAAVQSADPEHIISPFGFCQHIDVMGTLCAPFSMHFISGVARFLTWISLSQPPEAKRNPSGLNARQDTCQRWPFNRNSSSVRTGIARAGLKCSSIHSNRI